MLTAVSVFGFALLVGVFTTARATDIHEYLLFDFYSKLPPGEVNKHFDGLPVVKRHKVVGEGRYIFLVENEQTPELRKLSLPEDAYNERTFLAETSFDFLSHFTEKVSFKFDLTDFPDKDLYFVERICVKRDGTYTDMKTTMATFAQDLAKFYSQYSAENPAPAHGFVSSGHQPMKSFIFISMPIREMTEFVIKKDRRFGGPDACETSTTSIFNIA